MGTVIASITISVDGYIAGPDDGPGHGLGVGGERLHEWVFGGPWTYGEPPAGEAEGEDRARLDGVMAGLGAVVAGRWTYEAADHWDGANPWDVPLFVVTHRPEEEPKGGGFTFVGSFDQAIDRAKAAAGDGNVLVMGGADVIRQALAAGVVEELSIIVAPVILGAGKHLFAGFDRPVELEHIGVRQSRHATFIDYRVTSSDR